jgi:hypothetical protein
MTGTKFDFKVFMQLDEDVINEILGSWLTVQDLSLGLDIALTHSPYREEYLLHLYNSSVTLKPQLKIGANSIALELRPDLRSSSGRSTSTSCDGEGGVLHWLYHHNFAATSLLFNRNIAPADLELIDQRMIDCLRRLVFKVFVITDLDVYCIATCRRLKALTIDCWIGTSFTDDQLRLVCSHCLELETLELVHCDALTICSIEFMSAQLQALKCLVLDSCGGIRFINPLHIAELLGCIETLTINSPMFVGSTTTNDNYNNDNNLTTAVATAQRSRPPTKLIDLTLPVAVASAAASLYSKVKTLRLMVTDKDNDVEQHLTNIARTLSSLNALHVKFTGHQFAMTSLFSTDSTSRQSIEDISIDSTSSISSAVCRDILTNFPHLRRLRLSTATLEDDDDHRRRHEIHLDNEAPNNDDEVDDTILESQIGAVQDIFSEIDQSVDLPSLTYLSLHNMVLSSSGVAQLSNFSSQLTKLSLIGCRGMTSKSLQLLSRNCRQLTELSLARSAAVNDDVVIGFLVNSKQLTKLDVSSCCQLTDAVLEFLLATKTAVEVLDISRTKFCFSVEIILRLLKTRFDEFAGRGQDRNFRLCSLRVMEVPRASKLLEGIKILTQSSGFRESIFDIVVS